MGIPARSQSFTFLQQEGTGTFAGSFASITSNIPNTTSVVTPGPGTWSVQIQVPGCNVTLACNGHGTCQSDTRASACVILAMVVQSARQLASTYPQLPPGIADARPICPVAHE